MEAVAAAADLLVLPLHVIGVLQARIPEERNGDCSAVHERDTERIFSKLYGCDPLIGFGGGLGLSRAKVVIAALYLQLRRNEKAWD